jgi:hypothetical protein
MSKLGDRIRKAMRQEPAPIGFRAVRPEKNPQLLVAVQLDSEDKNKVADAAEKGAAAILLKGAQADDVAAAAQSAGEVPVGAWPKVVDPKANAALIEAGADFLVFDADSTPASALLDDKLGYVLALRSGQDENFLRVLESVALDAILLEDYVGPLTLRNQIELRLLAGLTRKTLMLPVKPSIESADLECLRDAGVSVLVIDDKALEELPALLKTVQDLPQPRRRRQTTLDVLLPRAAEMAAAEEEEEEEEEDG